jgi:hypothetical protein
MPEHAGAVRDPVRVERRSGVEHYARGFERAGAQDDDFAEDLAVVAGD